MAECQSGRPVCSLSVVPSTCHTWQRQPGKLRWTLGVAIAGVVWTEDTIHLSPSPSCLLCAPQLTSVNWGNLVTLGHSTDFPNLISAVTHLSMQPPLVCAKAPVATPRPWDSVFLWFCYILETSHASSRITLNSSPSEVVALIHYNYASFTGL